MTEVAVVFGCGENAAVEPALALGRLDARCRSWLGRPWCLTTGGCELA